MVVIYSDISIGPMYSQANMLCFSVIASAPSGIPGVCRAMFIDRPAVQADDRPPTRAPAWMLHDPGFYDALARAVSLSQAFGT